MKLDWTDEAVPKHPIFDDVYFNTEGGVRESLHVFIEGNQLSQKFADMSPGACFSIAETGFGTGLNCLLSCASFLETAPKSAHLHYFAVEKYLMTADDVTKALTPLDLSPELIQSLIDLWPLDIAGIHPIPIHPRITIYLAIGDVIDALKDWRICEHPITQRHTQPTVDAWFFDGFSPAKNPDMWQPELFKLAASLSRDGTSAATFSCARLVRDGLKDAGFQLAKRPGIGSKREVLSAILQLDPPAPIPEPTLRTSKFTAPYFADSQPSAKGKIAIIGAGLAGCHTANALARRGLSVTLMDRNEGVATQGSGNPQGVLYTKLSHRLEPLSEFALQSYLYATRFYRALDSESKFSEWSGTLQLAQSTKEEAGQQKVVERFSEQPQLVRLLNAEQASELSGVTINHSSLQFPQGGWLTPSAACEALVDHPNIQTQFNHEVHSLSQHDNGWLLNDKDYFDHVVVACAISATSFTQLSHLGTRAIRGQINSVQFSHSKLSTTLTGDGYITPKPGQRGTCGASFVMDDLNPEIRSSETLDNIQRLNALSADLEPTEVLGARVNFRCASPDYLPLVGPVADLEKTIERFGPLRKNRRADIALPAANLTGLWLNIAHGSKGITSTPLAAELLSSLMCKTLAPVSRDIARALNPNRFIMREIIRGKR